MQTVPKFVTYNDDETNDDVFYWGSSRKEVYRRYDKAMHHYNMMEFDHARALLQSLLEDDPYLIDGYNLLATVESELGNNEQGKRYQQQALEAGNKVIPNDFNGKIRWGFTELRALYAEALNKFSTGASDECVNMLERLLEYNPDDNQGARYLLGDAYFLEASINKAREIYEQNQDYPPYLYSLGLLNFVKRGEKSHHLLAKSHHGKYLYLRLFA